MVRHKLTKLNALNGILSKKNQQQKKKKNV